MRRRLLLLATLVALALALTIGVEAALAGNAAPQQATLTVSITGQGMGWVTSDPAGIRCGSVCSGQFAVGTTVKLFRIGAPGSTFAGISEPCKAVGSKNTGYLYCTVTLLGDTSVQATFNIAPPPPLPGRCVVRRVTGRPLDDAEDNLAAVNCRTGKITHAFSSTVPKGRVLFQSPSAGWQRANGAVDLVVSKGRR